MKKEHFTVTDTDAIKINKILNILPEEEFLEDFLGYLSANASYSTEYNYKIKDILSLSRGTFSQFENNTLNKKYILFNEKLSALYSFLMDNFFIVENTYYVGLYPEWKHSTEKESLWMNKYKELRTLTQETEKAFKGFLLEAKLALSQTEKTKEVYVELSVSDGLKIGSHSVKITKTQYPIVKKTY